MPRSCQPPQHGRGGGQGRISLGVAVNGADFFDCKYYSAATPSSLELTFYGIAENTVAASMSFEMAYNLIAHWASSYRGIGTRNSYCLGASDELSRMAEKERAAEEVEARRAETDATTAKVKEEEAERQAQLDRLTSLPGSSTDPHSLGSATHVGDNDRAASVSSDREVGREGSDEDGGIGVDTYERMRVARTVSNPTSK
jgi:hypothetical protein